MSERPSAEGYRAATDSVHIPDWHVLRLFNQYRLLVLLVLGSVYFLSENQLTLGTRNGGLFIAALVGYVIATLVFVLTIHLRKPTVNTQFFLQNYIDILLISVLMYASGGIQSGLGPLLLINLALFSQVSSARHAFLFAAIGSLVVLVEELLSNIIIGTYASDFEATAVLGALLFAIAWVMTVPVRRAMNRQLVNASHSRVGLNVEQIAQLNEEIIRELDSGVVVIDKAGNVQLINDTARGLLAAEFMPMPFHLRQLCEELLNNVNASELSPNREIRPFTVESTGQSVLPQFIPLSQSGMLIKLDDHTHILQQFQQLKLASLGRMSASMAHEIRNPLGAISHAVQLIEESPGLAANDANLLQIAKRHTQRINRIIEDVLQLSNRQQVRTSVVSVDTLLSDFAQRFCSEHNLSADKLTVRTEPCSAIVDPGHLDQILWNLCTNAQLHNDSDNVVIDIHCWQSERAATVIEIVDNGKGISDMERANLFEPFYSTHHAGTGLGLFIIRELCELNKAHIECLPSESGARFRITLAHAQDMAA
ncbi:sensor histidine kinase [Granulosicoccus antarcticus]|uniref:histidine kinase n=1 Tax=Granulosicoccus antarcticus IMCC3135 TaxID=1192854 RepID=A0A2Z2NXA0_9GAMM|nr:ATP-binding protein [Granulosicoccus antarcticus]ASJ75863.1 Sensor protein ZraS [Granulosicoccus antarcticus IMCC3135]